MLPAVAASVVVGAASVVVGAACVVPGAAAVVVVSSVEEQAAATRTKMAAKSSHLIRLERCISYLSVGYVTNRDGRPKGPPDQVGRLLVAKVSRYPVCGRTS